MNTALIILGWTLFGLAILTGLILDLVGLFGNWIILGALAILWALTGFEHFGILGLGSFIALVIIGEVLEMIASAYGAKKFGGSRGSMVASVICCILGAILGTPLIPIPIIGTLIGACLGAFIGAAAYEIINNDKDLQGAATVGVGAALGKVAGLFVKTFVGVAMLIVAALTY